MEEPIEIHGSKFKIVLILLGCACFVILAILLWNAHGRYILLLHKPVSVIIILFFGFGFILGLIKLFDRRPSIVIDDKGVLLNLSVFAGIYLPWHTVEGFQSGKINGTTVLLIYINNTKAFIKSRPNRERWLLRFSNRQYHTPISISANTLKIDPHELETILIKQWKRANSNQ